MQMIMTTQKVVSVCQLHRVATEFIVQLVSRERVIFFLFMSIITVT